MELHQLESEVFGLQLQFFDDAQILVLRDGGIFLQHVRADDGLLRLVAAEGHVVLAQLIDQRNNNGAAVYGHYYLVNASSSPAVRKAAWKLTWYFSNHEEEFLDQIGLTIPSKRLLDTAVYKNKKFADVFIEDMATANFVTTHESGNKFKQVLIDTVQDVMLGNVAPAEAARKGNEKINDILRQ